MAGLKIVETKMDANGVLSRVGTGEFADIGQGFTSVASFNDFNKPATAAVLSAAPAAMKPQATRFDYNS